MFPTLSPLQAACVIIANNLFGKAWMSFNWRLLFANKVLRNPFYYLPDSSKVAQLRDGDKNQDDDFKRQRAAQLNESEWTATLLPMCLYFAATDTDAGIAPTLMAYTQVGYVLSRMFVGYPAFLPFAVLRMVALVVGLHALWTTVR